MCVEMYGRTAHILRLVPTRTVPLRVDDNLIAQIDAAAAVLGLTRSEWWRQAARKALHLESVLPGPTTPAAHRPARSDMDAPPPLSAQGGTALLDAEPDPP